MFLLRLKVSVNFGRRGEPSHLQGRKVGGVPALSLLWAGQQRTQILKGA